MSWSAAALALVAHSSSVSGRRHLDRVAEPVDLLINEVQVREGRVDDQCVMGLKASSEVPVQGVRLVR